MRCHPAFLGRTIDRTPTLGPYRLQILAPDHVDEDYQVVVASAERLAGFMGGTWPQGLTLEDNHIDLCWHLREFDENRSFAWIARDYAGRYLGCVYVFPQFMAQAADVAIWVRSDPDADETEADLADQVRAWLAGPDWPDLEYRIKTVSGASR